MQQLVLTIEDEELLSRLQAEAEKRGKALPDLVLEALDWWIQTMEVDQDIADSKAVLEEYEPEGGVDAFDYFRQRAGSGAPQG